MHGFHDPFCPPLRSERRVSGVSAAKITYQFNSKMEPKQPEFKYGPFEQAITVLVVIGFAAHPSVPYSFLSPSTSHSGVSALSPPLIMVIGIAYLGFYLLKRQEYARTRIAVLNKAAAQTSSSSTSKTMSSSDVRNAGLSVSNKSGNPAPKPVPGGGLNPRQDPSSNLYRKNCFMTMQGPGRPALVPFPEGLRPRKGQAEGTLWWDNVPEDAKDLMTPPLDSDKVKAMAKNPWSAAMLEKGVELLKLAKRQREEGERFERVGNLLHTLLGLLLGLVDMRLGVVATIFFLWRHFSAAHAADQTSAKADLDLEKAELVKRITEAKKSATDQGLLASLQQHLARL